MLPGAALAIAVFVAFFLCTWLVVNPRLLYFWMLLDFPSFRRGVAYWQQFSTEPGGPVRYLAEILAQSYHRPWAGALTQTAVAVLLCAALAVLARRIGRRIGLLSLLPAVMLLVLHCRYVFVLEAALGLCVVVLGAVVCAGTSRRNQPLHVALLVLLTAAVYWAAAGMVLLFAALCVVAELCRRWWAAALAVVALAVSLPFAWGVADAGLRHWDAYRLLLPFHRVSGPWLTFLLWMLCLYPVSVIAMVALCREDRRREGSRPRAWRLTRAGLLVALVGGVSWLVPYRLARECLRLEAACRTSHWEGVLDAAEAIPATHYTYSVSFAVNRALWHKGRLLDEMFGFPQMPHGLLQAPKDAVGMFSGDPSALMALSDIYYELGRMNEAEHLAHEVLSMSYRPWVVARIANIRFAKGETDAARVFLNAIAQDLVYGPGARSMLECLADPKSRIEAAIPPWTPPEDRVERLTIETALMPLIGRGKEGAMALDYLIAFRLLAGDTEGFVRLIGTMAEAGMTRLPRHCQEAVLVHVARTGSDVDLHGLVVDPATATRFAGFLEALGRYVEEPEVLSRIMDEQFGDSYFHYYYGGGYELSEEARP